MHCSDAVRELLAASVSEQSVLAAGSYQPSYVGRK
jgi:hypothetical protein